MNKYKFEEIEVGLEESFCVQITGKMMEDFLDITGDVNPLHTDEVFAGKRGYPSCVCYGMLTASFMSTLAGVYLPGERSLIHSVETKFIKPVFLGDVLLVRGQVTEKNESFCFITLKIIITNQKDEKVLKGNMRVGFSTDGE